MEPYNPSPADSTERLAALAEQNCCLQRLVVDLLKKNEVLRRRLADNLHASSTGPGFRSGLGDRAGNAPHAAQSDV
jgi:hypothetical protein